MWYLEKELFIDSAHKLNNYVGKCAKLHGHRWKIVVYCRGEKLDNRGILIDFTEIKGIIDRFDHELLNDMFPKTVNPTAENLAYQFCNMIPFCYKVEIYETPSAKVIYVKD